MNGEGRCVGGELKSEGEGLGEGREQRPLDAMLSRYSGKKPMIQSTGPIRRVRRRFPFLARIILGVGIRVKVG